MVWPWTQIQKFGIQLYDMGQIIAERTMHEYDVWSVSPYELKSQLETETIASVSSYSGNLTSLINFPISLPHRYDPIDFLDTKPFIFSTRIIFTQAKIDKYISSFKRNYGTTSVEE